MMTDLAYEHSADLRREAAASAVPRGRGAARAAARADRARPRGLRRVTRLLANALHVRPCPMGCEA